MFFAHCWLHVQCSIVKIYFEMIDFFATFGICFNSHGIWSWSRACQNIISTYHLTSLLLKQVQISFWDIGVISSLDCNVNGTKKWNMTLEIWLSNLCIIFHLSIIFFFVGTRKCGKPCLSNLSEHIVWVASYNIFYS